MHKLVNYYVESSKNYKFKKFQAIPPIVPEIDSKWTLCLVYFYPNSLKVLKSHFLGRFSSREEMQILCDTYGITLED